MSRILKNYDVASLYPNLVRLYSYSSRNQQDTKAYVDLLDMRIKAKHGQLSEEFLKPMNLTNDDLKGGLKLPLNAYTGCLRAPFNPLYDNLCGFSICSTGQMFLLQLAHDLKEVPTVEICELNTDAVMFMVDEEYVEQTTKVLDDWQKLTGLELEEDNIKKMIMRDVNNYVEIVEVKDNNYEVHYKGGCFRGKHNFKWNKEKKTFEYSFEDDLENNSLTIVSEAMLKNLLFDIPVEETINKCDDVFRFQMITHLGGTYEKCVQESPNGDIELQRNNRIYAGLQSSGRIIKIKPDGRRDQLPNCPKNPIVDNDNKVTIEMINKKWYIKYAKQQISEFVGRKEIYMEEKLDKLKKDELIDMIKQMKEKEEMNEEENVTTYSGEVIEKNPMSNMYNKITQLREFIRNRNFILDKALPSNLGGGEYVSIEQYYQAIQDGCAKVGLDFSFEILNVERFDLAAFKPATGAPQNIATVKCLFTLTDIDTGASKQYIEISQGSDSVDKAVNGASTLAYRNWFDKNFTPSMFNGEKVTFGEDDTNVSLDGVNIPNQAKGEAKPPRVFVTPEKKEQIKEEITSEPQKTNNEEDIKKLTELIYTYRELSGNDSKGTKALDAIINGTITDAEVLSKTLSFENAIAKLKGENNA